MGDDQMIADSPDYLRGGRSFSPGSCRPDSRARSGPGKQALTCMVRYGYLGNVGEFRYSPGVLDGCGSKVVIQSHRGIEIGEQISLTCSGCDNAISRQQMLSYSKAAQSQDYYRTRAGRILRVATSQDLEENQHIQNDSVAKLKRAQELAQSFDLQMKFVVCEHLFGGERIIFHFMSENRIDFRELVKEIAKEYHTRIEMHQVGARDEARLVADYEICGLECCCKTFLKTLRPVSMRMAKLQKATLDPSKVSGRCGRLRCCLRFEHEGYEELNKTLPRVATRVRTEGGIGTIRARQVLTQLVTVQYDGSDIRETVGIEDLLETGVPKAREGAVGVGDGQPRKDGTARGDRADSRQGDKRGGRQSISRDRRSSRGGRRRQVGTEKEQSSAEKQPENVQGEVAERLSSQPDSAVVEGQVAKAGTDSSSTGEAKPSKKRRRRGGRRRRPKGDNVVGSQDTPSTDGNAPPVEGGAPAKGNEAAGERSRGPRGSRRRGRRPSRKPSSDNSSDSSGSSNSSSAEGTSE